MKFGEKLKDLRQKRKMTQDEVASAIGVSRRAYIAYEQGNVHPRKQETYDKLAKTLGCDTYYLRNDDTALNAMTAAISAFAAQIEGIVTSDHRKETNAPLTYTNDMLLQDERTQKKFAATAMGILYKAAAEKGIQCQQGNLKDIDGAGIRPDDYIIVKDQEIEDWWLIFWAKDSNLDEHIKVFQGDRAGVLISRFTTARSDPKRMATIVVDDIELYEAICRYKEHNSYRGNLSVVLVDTNEVRICKETLISSYEGDCSVEAAYISVL